MASKTSSTLHKKDQLTLSLTFVTILTAAILIHTVYDLPISLINVLRNSEFELLNPDTC